LRFRNTGRHARPVFSSKVRTVLAALVAASAPGLVAAAPAHAAVSSGAVSAAAVKGNGLSVDDFYRARQGQLLWFVGRTPAPQVNDLLSLLETSQADSLDANKYNVPQLRAMIARAQQGDGRDVRNADTALSKAFVLYSQDLRRPGDLGIDYVDAQLRPKPATPREILENAAKAPSLDDYVRSMAWMHPIYAELRKALLSGKYGDDANRIRVNMERARELPAASQKHIIVNAAAQRLYMYEDGKVVDSMKVVVGKPIYPTPMMAALIRFANLNPYWYVPPDLAAERIAPNVLREGMKYLDRQGYQVVSDFVDNPTIIDPTTIDWKAVADGKLNILIRQLPGPWNTMGRIKFMFPNHEGVYLHDNPERELFEEAARFYSGGCVRLESAWRLSHWLFGRDLTWKGAGTEEEVPLAKPVPVYITYLTAAPQQDGSSIAFFDDVYKRDATRMAALADLGPVTIGSAAATQGR
jgi:murein L,D-transpeptidase YcbB/YkuD